MARPLCKIYNGAPESRIRIWEKYAGTLRLALIAYNVLNKNDTRNLTPQMRELGIVLKHSLIFIERIFKVGIGIKETRSKQWHDVYFKNIVKKDVQCEIKEYLFLVLMLLEDLRKEYESDWVGEQRRLGKCLRIIESLYHKNVDNLEDISDDPQAIADDLYDAIYPILWKTQNRPDEPLSLYLVSNTYWVVARGRSMARDFIQQKFALAKRPMAEWISSSTELSNGRNAEWLISKAHCEFPLIVGLNDDE